MKRKIIIVVIVAICVIVASILFIKHDSQEGGFQPISPTDSQVAPVETEPRDQNLPVPSWAEETHKAVVSPVGQGLQGEEDDSLKTDPKYFSDVNLPNDNGYEMKAGDGFNFTEESLTDGMEITPIVKAKDGSTTFNLTTVKVEKGKLVIPIPTNITAGGYLLILDINDKAYEIQFDILPKGIQQVQDSY